MAGMNDVIKSGGAGEPTVLHFDTSITNKVRVDNPDLKDESTESNVVGYLNAVFHAAFILGATDIHIEPQEKSLRVRVRIDGELYQLDSIEEDKEGEEGGRQQRLPESSILARIKIISGMNISERREPQDGRITLFHTIYTPEVKYNIRVNSIPIGLPGRTTEKVAMRILGSGMKDPTLDKLAFEPEERSIIDSVLRQTNGIFLITGPTGSGKTTTLNAMIRQISKPNLNVVTIEDPIEYNIPGVNQVQVNEAGNIKMGFPEAMRAFLRQDPNIIMVGEMRDDETVEIAVRAALTGHLVLSTLHTNDAPSAIGRLVDMKAEPYLLADALRGIMAQRLVRCLCNNCKKPYTAKASELYCFGYESANPEDPVELFTSEGCTACNNTGYSGRKGIYEVMLINPKIQALIKRGGEAPIDEIRTEAKRIGMKELYEQALKMVLTGVTSIDQAKRAAFTGGITE